MSYVELTRITFANMLGTLDHLISRAQSDGMSDDVLLAKLTDDIFPLELQLRVAINQVLLALNQVAGQALPLEEFAYGSLSQVRERVVAVRNLMDNVPLDAWNDATASVHLTLPNNVVFAVSSEQDVFDWLVPNLYFHVTMGYALLRREGVSLGKMDFVPHMDRHVVDVSKVRV